MAIIKGEAEIRGPGGVLVGRGMAYLHLPKGATVRQSAGGTVSCQSWDAGAGPPETLSFEHGASLRIVVSQEAISECSRNHILRYTTEWQPPSEAS